MMATKTESISEMSIVQLYNLWIENDYKLCSTRKRDSEGNIIQGNGKIAWIMPKDVIDARAQNQVIRAELNQREEQVEAYMNTHPEELKVIRLKFIKLMSVHIEYWEGREPA